MVIFRKFNQKFRPFLYCMGFLRLYEIFVLVGVLKHANSFFIYGKLLSSKRRVPAGF
jgi:hypothetical protein